jgi:hypothetical protein
MGNETAGAKQRAQREQARDLFESTQLYQSKSIAYAKALTAHKTEGFAFA